MLNCLNFSTQNQQAEILHRASCEEISYIQLAYSEMLSRTLRDLLPKHVTSTIIEGTVSIVIDDSQVILFQMNQVWKFV